MKNHICTHTPFCADVSDCILKKGWEDEEFFFDFFVPHWRMNDEGEKVNSPEFHSVLRTMMDEGSVLAVIPRGFGKTTNGKLRLLRRICYGEVKDTLLWMSAPLLRRVMGDLRKELESNEYIRGIFGDLTPSGNATEKAKRWNEHVLEFRHGGRLEGISKFGSVRGGRYDEIWADDVQENKDVRNQEVADEFEYHFRSSLIPALKPNGRIHLTGTNVGTQSLIHRLWKDQNHTMKKMKFPALIAPQWSEKGELIGGEEMLWPERFDMKVLKSMAQNLGKRIFDQEFLHHAWDVSRSAVWDDVEYFVKIKTPQSKDTSGIEWFEKLENCKALYCGIDLARGGQKGDYTTFVLRNEKGELVASFEQKIVVEKFVAVLDGLVQKCGHIPLVVIPERNSAEAFFVLTRRHDWFGRVMWRGKDSTAFKIRKSEVYGWQTSSTSKQVLIDTYGQKIRKGIEMSEKMLTQAQNYIYDDRGRANAKSGIHDDLLMADMICFQAVPTAAVGYA